MLLPQELKKKEFARAMRGYEPAEVDEFVDFLVGKYSEVYTQCDRYDKKLRLVAERISQIQSEEEAIKKLAVSTQKLCENMTAEAEEESRRITDGANARAEAIIAEARETAESALAAINRKSEEKIKFIEEKSEELLLSVRTKCAGILNDFKKDIASQKDSIITLKNITEEFNRSITETYKKQIAELENNMPELKIDLSGFNESKLLAEIMNDIKNDAIKIANNEQWSSDTDFDGDLEKLKAGSYASQDKAARKEPVVNEKSVPVENADEDMEMTKTIPLQKSDKAISAADLKQQETEEFDIVKYKNENEKAVPLKPLDEIIENMSAGNETNKVKDEPEEDYDSDGAGEYDAYEEDDEDVESDKRSGKKKGFLGLFKRDKSEKKNKYNDDEDFDENENYDDDDDDYDDDDDDDDYYGLKNTDSRRTESSIFDD